MQSVSGVVRMKVGNSPVGLPLGLVPIRVLRALAMRRCLIAAVILALLMPAAADAQSGTSGLISPEAARQFGLERMWFTHLHVDRGRGRVAGLHLHVSDTRAYTVFQI